jgi:hypothetical protein
MADDWQFEPWQGDTVTFDLIGVELFKVVPDFDLRRNEIPHSRTISRRRKEVLVALVVALRKIHRPSPNL